MNICNYEWSDEMIDDPTKSAKVRQLNDVLRQTLTGGTVVVTAGVVALGNAMQQAILERVKAFDAFDNDNDPWNEHDMGAIDMASSTGRDDSLRVFWKIDY